MILDVNDWSDHLRGYAAAIRGMRVLVGESHIHSPSVHVNMGSVDQKSPTHRDPGENRPYVGTSGLRLHFLLRRSPQISPRFMSPNRWTKEKSHRCSPTKTGTHVQATGKNSVSLRDEIAHLATKRVIRPGSTSTDTRSSDVTQTQLQDSLHASSREHSPMPTAWMH